MGIKFKRAFAKQVEHAELLGFEESNGVLCLVYAGSLVLNGEQENGVDQIEWESANL